MARKNPEFWIVTHEGWGSEEDFAHLDGDDADTPLQALNELFLNQHEDPYMVESVYGSPILATAEKDDVPIYVYRLEFAGAYEFKPPEPPPEPPRKWRKVKRIGER
jgi:hypothetical protein